MMQFQREQNYIKQQNNELMQATMRLNFVVAIAMRKFPGINFWHIGEPIYDKKN